MWYNNPTGNQKIQHFKKKKKKEKSMEHNQMPLPVFHTGTPTSDGLAWPSQKLSLGFTRKTWNALSEKQTFGELWQRALRWIFFQLFFRSGKWTAQQLSVWHSAPSRCEWEMCRCLAVFPLYIKVSRADGGQNHSHKVTQRHHNHYSAAYSFGQKLDYLL